MRIGFLVGKEDEIHYDDELFELTPKKYLRQGNYSEPLLHTDVAIAMTIKLSYPDVSVDIIPPNEISDKRLQKNNVNFILGYDCINQMIDEPYVRKFQGKQGYNLLKQIYSSKKNKVFPPMNFLEFIWDKEKYLSVFQKKQIPISPTLVVSKYSTIKILGDIQKKGWKQFIIKPVGGTSAVGVERFQLKECLKNPLLITNYFEENKPYYPKFLIQELITGFKKYGEIKMYWINQEYSYAVNTIDKAGGDQDGYTAEPFTNKKILDHCKTIGEQALQLLPKIKVNNKVVKPVLVRTDFTCCQANKQHTAKNYFLNEVEHQDAGSYSNYFEIKYPYVQVMADSFVKKAQELISLGF